MSTSQAGKNKETSNVKEMECHQPMKWWSLPATAIRDHVPQGLVAVKDALWLTRSPRRPEYDGTLVRIFHVDGLWGFIFSKGSDKR